VANTIRETKAALSEPPPYVANLLQRTDYGGKSLAVAVPAPNLLKPSITEQPATFSHPNLILHNNPTAIHSTKHNSNHATWTSRKFPLTQSASANMGKAAVVNDQLFNFIQTNKVDIARLQEQPYTRNGK